ncbi:ABC transporter permease [Desulfosarcina ovata subsp. sediminis]|uniref:ABC transporter permease n=1 Tax=Desulfosarcina ovata subsp. sediminis TaxID=885957 RepID=A0A5K7ZL58_9BACT|nr:ABC transporter permease [Desulfosarcina ovata]BBO80727.1 ABC transporter permease [Desulfosarcina ovata subsp. sediminis]
MKTTDVFGFCSRAVSGYPLRSGLMLLAMAIGVAAVVLLSTLGESTRRYITTQFSSLGTHLLIILPGRSETIGGPPPMMGQTPRDLTIGDAVALSRSHAVRRVAPIVVGSAPVSTGSREREISILGSTADLLAVRNLTLANGRFIPAGDILRAEAVCVLGHTARKELFGNRSPLGRFVRIGERRFRVIGSLARKGQSLGVDISDVAIIPVASATALFNTDTLFRVLVEAKHRDAISRAKRDILAIVRDRHDGEDDITVITQDAMLATFDRILRTLTLTVAGIAAISLAVAGILIMNVMLIAISQRTEEIGLLKAIGATRRQVLLLFLVESTLLSLAGAMAGLLLSVAGLAVLQRFFPQFPLLVPWWSPMAATATAMFAGTLFGILPADRAARLDAVAALAEK